MSKLVFKRAGVLPLVAHAKASADHSPTYGRKPEAGLFLVHDQGIYLMSSGLPRLMADGTLGDEKSKGPSMVAYAKDCHPIEDEDFWDNARDLVGGDDFAELLPLRFFEALETSPDETFIIRANANSFAMEISTGATRAELIEMLAKAAAEGKVFYFESPRHRSLVSVKGKDFEAAKQRVRTIHPKSVILDELPEDRAIVLLAKGLGAKIVG